MRGLSCGTRGLRCSMWDLQLIFTAACRIFQLQHVDFLVTACMQDLVPRSGIEPGPPALGTRSLTHWTATQVPVCCNSKCWTPSAHVHLYLPHLPVNNLFSLTGKWAANSLVVYLFIHQNFYFIVLKIQDFPGGALVGSPPANAGDTGSSPGPGGSHMPWSNWARAPQLLSLCSRAHEPQGLKPGHLEPVLCNKRGHHNEKSAHSGEEQPLLAQLERARAQQ